MIDLRIHDFIITTILLAINQLYRLFQDDCVRAGSGSFPRRQGLDGQHDPDAYSSMRQRIDRNSQGGRAEGRSAYGGPVSEGGYIHGNDPNLSLQEGDSVYHDPYCGNLNFARRTHCNNNNKHRYGPELSAPNHTSWRAFCHGSPSRTLDGIGHVLSHDSDRYGSLPPHGWGVVEDSRMPPPGCGAKFAGFKRRKREDYHDELEYRKGHQLHRPAAPEWDERDGDRDTQRRSMSSRGRWISRGRRCSPLVDRSLRGSFLGHGRDTVQRRGYRQFESQRKRRRSWGEPVPHIKNTMPSVDHVIIHGNHHRSRICDQHLPSQSGLVTAFTFPHRFSSARTPGARRRALRDASFRPSTQHGTRRNALIAVVDEFSGTICRRDVETEDMRGDEEETELTQQCTHLGWNTKLQEDGAQNKPSSKAKEASNYTSQDADEAVENELND
ncbi:hypothetical protein GW17_00011176 [Ensete ventricosum]|nr:hypothetical protein GW17_00011176 [Ensete ventricosum]